MSQTSCRVPPALLPSVGGSFFDGTWLVDDDGGHSRLCIRVREALHEEKSPHQSIAVYDTEFFGRVLALDNVIMLTERDEFVYHEMAVHVALCSVPEPSAVLILGGGDCGCLREVLKHPSVERAVQCEVDERVTRVCERFLPWVPSCLEDRRTEVIFEDALRYAASSEERFDVVIVDSTDPGGAATGLFLRGFYRSVARLLSPGGVMVAQTENPLFNPAMVAAIYGELRAVFRRVASYLGFVPTYCGGCWSWAYASQTRAPGDQLDEVRARDVSATCRYYNAELHRAAFTLPSFVQQVVSGDDPLAGYRAPAREAEEPVAP